jgi:hypothetical protein
MWVGLTGGCDRQKVNQKLTCLMMLLEDEIKDFG